MRHAQPDRGDAGLDRVDVLPVDVALGRRQVQVARDRPVRALHAQPAEQPGRPDVDGHEVELAVDVVETQVVDPDHPAAVDVHDLLVEQVGPQQDLVGALLEPGDVDRVTGQPRARRVEPGDLRPGQEDPAAVGRDDEPGDGRIAVADGDDQVVDLAQRLAGGVEHGPADGVAQVEHGGHLASGSTRRRWRDPSRVAVSRQEAGRTGFMVRAARSPPMGLGPSSTGMCRPRMRGRTAVDTGPATLAECSPTLSEAVNDTTPSGTKVLPGTGTDGGLPRPPVAVGPSGRARAPRRTRRNARPGRAVDGRPDDLGDGCQRRRLDLPAVRRRRPADPHGRPARDRRAAVDRARTRRRPPAARRSSPSASTRSSGSPGAWPPRTTATTLIRMIVDETRRGLRADASTIRMLRDDRLEVTAWAGLPDEVAGRLPVLRRDEGWVGEVLRTGHVLAFAGHPRRSASTATPGTTASSRSPATWPLR